VCGQGILSALGTESGTAIQDGNSRVIETYTCGHQAGGAALETADPGSLEVERRSSEDTVPPIEPIEPIEPT
jgi:hypothetical protein